MMMREGTGRPGGLQCAIVLMFALLGCARSDDSPPISTAGVRPGIDVLLEDSLALVQNARVGLITNQTGIAGDGRTTALALASAPGVRLVALFSPEHGFRGTAAPGESIADTVEATTGLPIRSLDGRTGGSLPIRSLYGDTRKPTRAMLEDIDVLVFDIQDVGARYYTYLWTMALAMQAAAEQGKRFIVLDRPDPIGGDRMGGNVLDTAFASFVGLYPVPMRHGLTAGEMARLINTEYHVGANLTVVPMKGWRRADWFDTTGLQWVAPSPNMPDLESATSYPGTCLFEGTNLSVGRGTVRPFQQIGAPWLEAGSVVSRLEDMQLPGVRFEAVEYTPASPADAKYDGVAIHGIRFIVTDRRLYDPVSTAVSVLIGIRSVQPGLLEFDAGFDRLAGTDQLRRSIEHGTSASTIIAGWQADLAKFEVLRRRYLLYD
jgi:uncharacterized protein YbbC (DUF1343 family)